MDELNKISGGGAMHMRASKKFYEKLSKWISSLFKWADTVTDGILYRSAAWRAWSWVLILIARRLSVRKDWSKRLESSEVRIVFDTDVTR